MSKQRRKCAGCQKEITSYPCVFCLQRSATEGPPSQSVPVAAVAMVFIVGLVLVVMTIGDGPSASSSQSSLSTAWYVGGDLHRKTVADWQAATYENRLATSADFVMGMGKYSSLPPDLRAKAAALERCISEAGRDVELVGGKEVSELGAVCGVLLGY